ncbi:Rho GTPase activation protein, partial [Gorgonomyces haynaldii]
MKEFPMFSYFSSTHIHISPEQFKEMGEQLLKPCGSVNGVRMYGVYPCVLPRLEAHHFETLSTIIIPQLEEIAKQDYILVLFTAGGLSYPSFTWLLFAYNKLSYPIRKNLKKLVIVHAATWSKILMKTMGSVISPKFNKKLYWVKSLAECGQIVPLHSFYVPELVLNYDQAIPQSPASTAIFGTPIDSYLEIGQVPRMLEECLQVVKNNLDTPGLFRVAPTKTSLVEGQRRYNLDLSVDVFQLGGVHLACGLIKLWLRELPTPVLPVSLYPLVQGMKESDGRDYIKHTLVPAMDPLLIPVLKSLFQVLLLVHQHSDQNLMPSSNLSLMFCPNLMRGTDPLQDLMLCGNQSQGFTKIVRLCIEESHYIF